MARLEECGIPLTELRHQWRLQREAQLSIRARKLFHVPCNMCV
jgi:hypothetical protein